MSNADRLYCTHCTFGSSALETGSAENAAKVLGYSVRASSLPASERGRLRQVFRSIERLLSYDLPRDATPADKESLDASSAPRRLIFLPLLGDCQVVGQVSYRSHDTAGRPGSYFADMIVSKIDVRQPDNAWSPLDCLRLWGTGYDNISRRDWWCDSEDGLPEGSGGDDGVPLPAVASLADVWQGSSGALVSDAVLQEFLRDDAAFNADHDASAGLIPPRWRQIPIAQRQELFARLLQATISVVDRGRDTVTIAAEPSLAAVLFYGVCRVLPPTLIRHSRDHQGLSFSTFEPFPERPMTSLVATTFLHGSPGVDLPAEVYQRGFACNTFVDGFRYGRVAEPGAFAQRIMTLLTAPGGEGFVAIDGLLAAIGSLPRVSSQSLDGLIRIDDFVVRYLGGTGPLRDVPNAPRVHPNSEDERFLGERLLSLIERDARGGRTSWPPDLLETSLAWCGDALGNAWAEAGLVRDVLRTLLPTGAGAEQRLLNLLSSQTGGRALPDEIMFEAVASVAQQVKRIPICVADIAKQGGHRSPDWMLQILRRLPEPTREAIILNSDMAVLAPLFLEAVVRGNSEQPVVRAPALEQLLCKVLDDDTRPVDRTWNILEDHAAILSFLGPHRTLVAQSLDRLFGKINESPPRSLAGQRTDHAADILKRWAELSSTPSVQQRQIDEWRNLQKSLGPLIEEATKTNQRRMPFGGKRAPSEAVANAITKLEALCPNPLGVWTAKAAAKRKRVLQKALKSRGLAPDHTKLVTGWIETLLDTPPQDFSTKTPQKTPRTRSLSRELAIGLSLALVIASASVGGLVFWQEWGLNDLFGPHGTQAKQDPKEETPKKASQPSKTAASPASSARPNEIAKNQPPEAQPPTRSTPKPPLTKEKIGLNLNFDKGELVTKWNKDAVSEIPITLTITSPPDTPEIINKPTSPHRYEAKAFGSYSVKLVVEPKDAPKIEVEKQIELPKPTPPKLADLKLDLSDLSKPKLTFTITPSGQLSQYGTDDAISYIAVAAGQEHDELGTPSLAEAKSTPRFTIPTDPNTTWTPERVRTTQFQLVLRTPLGKSEPSTPKQLDTKALPHDCIQFLKQQQRNRTVLGVPGVWDIFETETPSIPLHPMTAADDVDVFLLTPSTNNGKTVSATPDTDSSEKTWRLALVDAAKADAEGGTSVEKPTPIGCMRINRTSAWAQRLEYIPDSKLNHADSITEAKGLLSASKLKIIVSDSPVFFQLHKPISGPPLLVDFKWQSDKDTGMIKCSARQISLHPPLPKGVAAKEFFFWTATKTLTPTGNSPITATLKPNENDSLVVVLACDEKPLAQSELNVNQKSLLLYQLKWAGSDDVFGPVKEIYGKDLRKNGYVELQLDSRKKVTLPLKTLAFWQNCCRGKKKEDSEDWKLIDQAFTKVAQDIIIASDIKTARDPQQVIQQVIKSQKSSLEEIRTHLETALQKCESAARGAPNPLDPKHEERYLRYGLATIGQLRAGEHLLQQFAGSLADAEFDMGKCQIRSRVAGKNPQSESPDDAFVVWIVTDKDLPDWNPVSPESLKFR